MFPPDVATLIADHGLAVQLQAVLRVEGVQVGLDQSSETRVQVDPGTVPADSHVAYPHFRPAQVTCRDDGDWHQDLVKITLQAAGNLEERTPFLVSSCLGDNLGRTLRKVIKINIASLPVCQTISTTKFKVQSISLFS